MIDTIGKRLCQARLARGLSLDEAAHATRMRPDKLIALENDDYSRFGSNAYAKGFLQIYGRYLGVDVTNHLANLETPKQVSISDYQYLNNAPEPETRRISVQKNEQRPSVLPLVLFLCSMGVAVATGFGFWVNVNMQRIEASDTRPASTTASTPEGAPPLDRTTPRRSVPGLAPVSNPQPPVKEPAIQAGNVSSGPAEPIGEPPHAADPTPFALSAPITNEVVVEPLKTTWVKIRRDRPDATPVFEDFLYHGAGPLRFRGDKFFVEVRDQDAVRISKNGVPIAYQAPGISIQ